MTATEADRPATAGRTSVGLGSLPRAGVRDVATGLQRYFRPGTHRSPLSRLGDRFVVDLPGAPTLLVTRAPADAKAILADREQALSLGDALHRLTPHPVLFGGDSLIFLEGEEHARRKRRMNPPFHGEMMKSYAEAMTAIADARIDAWPTHRPVAFVELAQGYVLEVMRTIIFGVRGGERTRRLDAAMLRYCAVAEGDPFLGFGIATVVLTGRWRSFPPLERAAAAVDAIVLEEIAERRRDPAAHPGDFLTHFLAGNDASEEPLDDATLARDMRGLMLAGYETTAITLGWIVEMLVHHPEVLERVRASVDAGQDASLDAVIAEVMRLRPAFPFAGRRARRPFALDGVRVPAGTLLVIAVMALHERADIHPDPLAFRPERFLGERPGTYTWLTFGGGVHRCLGAAFALFESRVLLRRLLESRTLEAVDPRPEGARRTHPMLIPGRGGRVVLRPRG